MIWFYPNYKRIKTNSNFLLFGQIIGPVAVMSIKWSQSHLKKSVLFLLCLALSLKWANFISTSFRISFFWLFADSQIHINDIPRNLAAINIYLFIFFSRRTINTSNQSVKMRHDLKNSSNVPDSTSSESSLLTLAKKFNNFYFNGKIINVSIVKFSNQKTQIEIRF